MKSFTKHFWDGTVKFQCNTCNGTKIYRIKNKQESLAQAERDWITVHTKECK